MPAWGLRRDRPDAGRQAPTVAKYTEYDRHAPEMLYGVWRNPDLLDWLLAQKLGIAP